MSAVRDWRPRRSGYYPLLVSGLGFLEYLSPEDCALIADALDISLNPQDDNGARQRRVQALVECFKAGTDR